MWNYIIGVSCIIALAVCIGLMFIGGVRFIIDPYHHGFIDIWGAYIVGVLMIVMGFVCAIVSGVICFMLILYARDEI